MPECAKIEVWKESKQVDIENKVFSQSDVEICVLVSLASAFKTRNPEENKLK